MKILELLLIAVLLLGLVSCSDTVNVSKSADELTESVILSVPLPSGYYKPSDSYFEYCFSEADESIDITALVSDWSIMKSSSQSSENEVGVLIARDGCLQRVKEACLEYLEDRQAAYLEAKASYSPGEYEKYRDAECFVYGSCVFYLILGADDRAAAKRSIELTVGK